MISVHFRPLRAAAALLALAAIPAGARAQQSLYPPGAVVQPLDTGDALPEHLGRLSENPRDLDALLGAAQAALDHGDVDGALSFYARAEEVAPRDGRVKAGMGSAFVQAEKPEAALRFFGEAASLGIPAARFAKDRGLAYDMTGDPVRAQADYALALGSGPDAETERRFALSKAISGDVPGALALLEPQLQRQERAAWRARAFVVALAGRTDEAARLVETLMPGTSATMRPFLEMLPRLGAADRAMAVHFGRFPDRRQWASLAAAPAAQPARPAMAPARAVQPQAPPPARQALPPQAQPQPVRPAPVQPQPVPAQAQPVPAQAQPQPVRTARAEPAVAPRPAAQPVQGPPDGALQPRPAAQPSASMGAEAVAPAATRAPLRLQFADVAATVQSLPSAPAPAPAPRARQAAPPAAPQPKKAAAPREPKRHWVQLAASRDIKAFPFEFRRIKARAPDLLGDKTPWTAPLGATNRLLVGPFRTAQEARDLVKALSGKQIESLSWTSEQGEKVERVPVG